MGQLFKKKFLLLFYFSTSEIRIRMHLAMLLSYLCAMRMYNSVINNRLNSIAYHVYKV